MTPSSHLDNPQNPYQSYIVKASAGTGKTYQLSKRFLCLAGAGTDPSLILTVTFTKKAAAEMRERILKECRAILNNPDIAQEFDALMQGFYQPHQGLLPEPLSATATATRILTAQQNLNIKTIDSLFAGWVKTFDFEASGEVPLPSSMEPLADYEMEEFVTRAWQDTLHSMSDNESLLQMLAKIFPEEGLTAIQTRLKNLSRNDLLIWLAQQQNVNALQSYSEPPAADDSNLKKLITFFQLAQAQVAAGGQRDIASFLAGLPKAPTIEEFVEKLRQTKIISSSLQINGQKFKKLKTLYPQEIDQLHEVVKSHHNLSVIRQLNQLVALFSQLHSVFQEKFQYLKFSQNRVDHNDLAKGAYRIFHDPDTIGARYLIQRGIHHLLLDEFQDTNALQWSIFKNIANELLSGLHHDLDDRCGPGTLFVVGDEKQSIYGFREADAKLLGQVRYDFEEQLAEVELNHSYRTSQLLFDVINQCFSDAKLSCFIEGFPPHQTAKKDGRFVKPNVGSFVISPLFEDDEKNQNDAVTLKGLEKEAQFIARYCRKLLDDKQPSIWDKATESLRLIRPSDIAILYRTKTHSKAIEAALIEQGIIYGKAENEGFFDQAEIQDVFSLFRLMCLPGDLESLCAVLRSPIVNIDESILATELYGSKDASLEERMTRLGNHSAAAKEIIQHALLKLPADLSAQRRFLTLMSRLHITEKYEQAWPHLAQRSRAHLEQFCQLLGQLSGASDLHVLYKLEQIRDKDAIGLSDQNNNSVSLMTIHKSKGLEFPVVFLTDADDDWTIKTPYWAKADQRLFYIGKNDDSRPVDDLEFERVLATETKAHHEEHVRLLYVALTRACHHVIISAHRSKKNGFYGDLATTLSELGASMIDFGPDQVQVLQSYDVTTVESKGIIAGPASPERLPIFKEAVIPTEIFNKQPSLASELKPSASQHLPFEPVYYQAIGLFVHKGLENEVKKSAWNPEKNWQQIVKDIGWLDSTLHAQALAEAQAQLVGVLHSDIWASLFRDCQQAKAEMPITYLHHKALIHGVIDLVTQDREGHVHVTDYKSIYLPRDPMNPAEIEEICREKGYLEQVRSYMRGCQLLYPEQKVSGGILLTASKVYISVHL